MDANTVKHGEEEFRELEGESQEAYVTRTFWQKMKQTASKVPFVLDAVAMYYAAVDLKTPVWAKAIAFGALAYFIMPVDAIPDWIALVGFTDDAGAIMAALKALGAQVTDEHRQKATEWANE
jgi:uncharacterized membrane protein YkvA (DUF1232 family)